MAATLVPVEQPEVLSSSTPATTVRVEHRTDADERQVQLALETGAPRVLTTTREGTVTAMHCATGGTVRSGDVVATTDGLPVIALATSTPLWRDIADGDRGDDVRALQAELARLGAPLVADGVAGGRTIRAATAFLVERGLPRSDVPDGIVPRDAFAWIASSESTVRSCSGVVGASVPSDGALVLLPSELRSARLEAVPADAGPGERDVVVGGATIPIGADGVVGDPVALAELASSPEYEAAAGNADDGAPTIGASWVLRKPVEVDVVPPTALWAVRGGHACVQPVGGSARRVTVVGSELGQTFIRADDGTALERVRATPDRGRTCR